MAIVMDIFLLEFLIRKEVFMTILAQTSTIILITIFMIHIALMYHYN